MLLVYQKQQQQQQAFNEWLIVELMPYGVGGGMIQKIQEMGVERKLHARIV